MTTDFTLDHRHKSYPAHRGECLASQLGAKDWNVLANDFAFPLAVIREDALAHNLQWMQAYAQRKGVWLAPHAKTPLSPQLAHRQLQAGAWGLTFATVFQAQVGVQAGATHIIIANQVVCEADLNALVAMREAQSGLRIWFLVDSLAQLSLIEDWAKGKQFQTPLDVLLEIGIAGQRTGCRTQNEALQLARALAASDVVRLGGVECYEGGLAQCNSEHDAAAVTSLVRRVIECLKACDAEGLLPRDEVMVTAGGSAVFDLVIPLLQVQGLTPSVRGVLRSGCYLTHDHGNYAGFLKQVEQREQLASSLQPALCIWTMVQSVPEPGLALLTCGRRDISYDQRMPIPVHHAPIGSLSTLPIPSDWAITALNDQHAYLRFDAAQATVKVGDRVGLGISHPCTTFDKWRWMALADSDWTVTGAISTCF
ncbi:MAG: amino acid deaminase [Betaproteobacteria bacterium]|nr:amino acid deaminase [Betaproteobacteria bacterium]